MCVLYLTNDSENWALGLGDGATGQKDLSVMHICKSDGIIVLSVQTVGQPSSIKTLGILVIKIQIALIKWKVTKSDHWFSASVEKRLKSEECCNWNINSHTQKIISVSSWSVFCPDFNAWIFLCQLQTDMCSRGKNRH